MISPAVSLGRNSTFRQLCRTTFRLSYPLHSRQLSNNNDKVEDYESSFRRSLADPRGFWADAAEKLVWHKKWDRILDDSNPPFIKWFVGGEISACYNAVDRHVEAGDGDKVALIHDSPVTNSCKTVTYGELLSQVRCLADVLRRQGVEKGDRVVIYMPMIPEACVAMLAVQRLGACHSLVFGGFAAKELATRIDHAMPKVILTTNCAVEPDRIIDYKATVDEALKIATHPTLKTLVFDRPEALPAKLNPRHDLNWQEAVAGAIGVDCVPSAATDPMYILYTSGTTGKPKGIPRPLAGQIVCLHWSMKNLYGMNPGEAWFCASDLGWVVGHCYVCYGPLLAGNPSIIYEGKPVTTPDAGALWRVLSQHGAAGLFASPSFVRAVRRVDPNAALKSPHDLSKLRNLFLAGEHLDVNTLSWLRDVVGEGVGVLDHWWQTETGFAITAPCVGMSGAGRQPDGSAGLRVPGWDLRVLREDGSEAEPNELGSLAAKLPLPPASFDTLYKADDRFVSTYFEKFSGYYDTQDAGMIDADGFVFVLSRQDDVINVSGKRISGGALEEAIMRQTDVAECCVFAIPDELQGERPVGLAVLKGDVVKSREAIAKEIVGLVRSNVGPVAGFKTVVFVPRLPKTRTGKIPRSTIADLATGNPVKIPVTIEDETVYGPLDEAFKEAGLKLKVKP